MSLSLLRNMGILLFFVGAFFFVLYLFPKKREKEPKNQLKDDEMVTGDSARFVNIFRPFFQIFLPIVKKLPLYGYKNRIEKYAVTAGIEKEITGDDFIGFQITTGILFIILTLLIFKSSFFVFFGSIFGLCYPFLWLYEKKKNRQQGIPGWPPKIPHSWPLQNPPPR